jgi:hypothetical protein
VVCPYSIRRLAYQFVFNALLDKLGDHASPAGLVAGAQASAVVAVKVLIK